MESDSSLFFHLSFFSRVRFKKNSLGFFFHFRRRQMMQAGREDGRSRNVGFPFLTKREFLPLFTVQISIASHGCNK